MKTELSIHYDQKGDVLEIRLGKPTKSYFEDKGNDIFQRIDEKTKEIKGYTIFNFKKRSAKLKDIGIKIPAQIKLLTS